MVEPEKDTFSANGKSAAAIDQASSVSEKSYADLLSQLTETKLLLASKEKMLEELQEHSDKKIKEHLQNYQTVKADMEKALSDLSLIKETTPEDCTKATTDEKDVKIQELEQKLDAVTSDKIAVDAKYENLLGKLSGIRTTLGERLKTDAAELTRCKEKLKTLESDNKILNDNVSSLTQTNSALQSANKNLNESVESLKKDLVKSGRESDGLSRQLDTLKREFSTLESKHDETARLSKNLKVELERAQLYSKNLENSLMEEQTIKASLESKIQTLEELGVSNVNYEQEYIKERDAAQAKYEQARQDLENKTISTTLTINNLNDKIENLNTLLAERQKELENTNSKLKELDHLNQELADLKKEFKEKNLQLGKLRHDNITLNDHLSKAMKLIQKNSQGDTVDKQLVSNMFLSFLSLPRADSKRFEILQLISNFLSWDEEQKVQAGLARTSDSGVNSAIMSPITPIRRSFSGLRGFGDEFTHSNTGGREGGGFLNMLADYLERERK